MFETALVIYLARINPDISAVTIGVPVLNRSSVPMGPSECTIYIVGGEMSSLKRMPQQSDITLGTPIANTQIYILDGDLRPVPMGAPASYASPGKA